MSISVPQTSTDASYLASVLLLPLRQLGPGRATGMFEFAAAKAVGPIVAQVEFPSNPILPNWIITRHADGTVVLWLGGVDQATQILPFLGLNPDSGFSTLGGMNDSVQSYASNVLAKLPTIGARTGSPVFAIGHSFGGAALAVVAGKLSRAVGPGISCALSVGAPKPGSSLDFNVVNPPAFYRFWSPLDPIPALPPQVVDAPIAAVAAGPVVAYNWNQQVQAGGGYAVESQSNPYPAVGGRTNILSNVVSLVDTLSGGPMSTSKTHSINSYIGVLSQPLQAGVKPSLQQDADAASKPNLMLDPVQVRNLITEPGFVAVFDRESSMVPRVTIPPGEFAKVVIYLNDYAVEWQGQLLARFSKRYMAGILVRQINHLMRRSSLAAGFEPAAWISAVTSWTGNLQAIGGGYSPQPPIF